MTDLSVVVKRQTQAALVRYASARTTEAIHEDFLELHESYDTVIILFDDFVAQKVIIDPTIL